MIIESNEKGSEREALWIVRVIESLHIHYILYTSLRWGETSITSWLHTTFLLLRVFSLIISLLGGLMLWGDSVCLVLYFACLVYPSFGIIVHCTCTASLCAAALRVQISVVVIFRKIDSSRLTQVRRSSLLNVLISTNCEADPTRMIWWLSGMLIMRSSPCSNVLTKLLPAVSLALHFYK